MEVKDMKLTEVQERIKELRAFEPEGATLEEIQANTVELRALNDREEAIMKAAEERKAEIEKVVNMPNPEVIATFKEERKMEERIYGIDTKEYRSAFLKNLVGKEMTVEERAAFTHTTANTTAPLPTTMLNNIWDLVSKAHSIMDDITVYRTGTIIEVVKHTAIAAGAAAVTAQGVANANDEQNTFVKVTLSGKDFSKHVLVSYAMAAMSIEALEDYLTNEIATNVGEALADDTISTIETGIAAGNKTTSAAVKVTTYKELAAVFGQLKKVKSPVVYVNNATFYNYIVSIVDTTGRPVFQPSMQEGAMGVLIGARVKIEESVGDNKILVGDPKMVVCNMVQDILIEKDRDIKTHTDVYAGYARAESALLNDTSFALLTIKQA